MLIWNLEEKENSVSSLLNRGLNPDLVVVVVASVIRLIRNIGIVERVNPTSGLITNLRYLCSQLELVIDNLPTLPGRFSCAFTALDKTLITNATRKPYGVNCTTPRTDSLPSIPPGQRKFTTCEYCLTYIVSETIMSEYKIALSDLHIVYSVSCRSFRCKIVG